MNTLHAFLEDTNLLSLYLITWGEKKKLSPLPFWVSSSLEDKTMNFVPVSKESLELLSNIHYTFSTRVNPTDIEGLYEGKT